MPMKFRFILSAIGFFSAASPAFAETIGEWWSGWAMGTSEFGYTDHSGNKLLISCSDDSGTSISVQVDGRTPKEGDNLIFVVDGDKVEFMANDMGQVPTFSRVDSSNFQYLWGKLRTGSQLTVSFSGNSAIYPLKGSAKALEAEPCTTDFDR